MSVVRVGATKQYSDNWENIFSGGKGSSTKKKAGKPARKSAKKTATVAKKATGKKGGGKPKSK
jgi:hypothetical protein